MIDPNKERAANPPPCHVPNLQEAPRRLQDASNQIFIIFWMPFWIDFGSVFPPNLEPKIQQNRSKIDAEMASHVDLIFGSIFPRFLLPTWTLRTSFGASGLAPNGFFRIFRKPHIGMRFWCELGSIFAPKSHENPSKNRSQDASIL